MKVLRLIPPFVVTLFLVSLAHGEQAKTTIWRFPDAHAPVLQAALLKLRSDALSGHLIADAAVKKWLARQPPPKALGCLEDRRSCVDPRLEALALLGIKARMDARATPTASGFEVTFTKVPTRGEGIEVFAARGKTIPLAAKAAFEKIRGHGILVIEIEPSGASVLLDGAPIGGGPGRYPVAPGEHTLSFQAPGRKTQSQKVRARAGRAQTIKVVLAPGWGELTVNFSPPDAEVRVDGERLIEPTQPKALPPGEHILRVTAPDHDPLEKTVQIKTDVRLELTVGLQPEEAEWRRMFRKRIPHPDTQVFPLRLKAGLRFSSIGAGDLDLSRGSDRTTMKIASQDESVGIWGLEFGVGWVGRYLAVDVLTLTLEGGGDRVDASTDQGESSLKDLSRTTLRAGWVGGRYPIWRLEPYATAGLLMAFDTFTVSSVLQDDVEVDDTRILFGTELGVRYFFDDYMFASTALSVDFWPGERTATTFSLGVGYALEMPEWL